MSTSVKHIHNGMRGAPQISGTAGTLIAALDALFTSGWGITTALSVTVADGIATAQLTPGETFDRTAVVLVAGATPGELNGESRVLTSSNTAITWATTAADGVATGTITIKYAPQTSWVKGFAGTSKAEYHSTHVQSNGHSLRIDDTGTTTARVRGYETMTDVDTGTGPFPSDTQMSGGGYIHKSIQSNATPVKYRIFCDERFVVFSIAAGSGANAANKAAPARGFGDPLAFATGGDAWSTLLSATGSNAASAYTSSLDCGITTTSNGVCVMPRAVSGLGSSVNLNVMPFTGAINLASGADDTLGSILSDVDGRIRPSHMFVKGVAVGSAARAQVPGVHYLPHSNALGVITDGDFLDGAGDLSGRRLMCVATGPSLSATPTGVYLMDITGPWR